MQTASAHNPNVKKSSSVEYHWHAIYTRPRWEKRVAAEFCRAGIEHYLPIRKTLKQWSDRKKWVEAPLLPSYIFVKVSEKEYYNTINTMGAVRYICFNGKAAPIPPQQIEALRLLLQNEMELEVTAENIRPGQKIEVLSGALSGLKGEYIRFQGQQKVIIRIEHIAQSILVEIPAHEIRPL